MSGLFLQPRRGRSGGRQCAGARLRHSVAIRSLPDLLGRAVPPVPGNLMCPAASDGYERSTMRAMPDNALAPDHAALDDHALVGLARSGDREAFRHIMQ